MKVELYLSYIVPIQYEGIPMWELRFHVLVSCPPSTIKSEYIAVANCRSTGNIKDAIFMDGVIGNYRYKLTLDYVVSTVEHIIDNHLKMHNIQIPERM